MELKSLGADLFEKFQHRRPVGQTIRLPMKLGCVRIGTPGRGIGYAGKFGD